METVSKRTSGLPDGPHNHSTEADVQFEVLQPDQLGRIEPLWLELNRHHLVRSANFKGHFRTLTFEQRCKKLLAPGKRLFIEIAVTQLGGYGGLLYFLNRSRRFK